MKKSFILLSARDKRKVLEKIKQYIPHLELEFIPNQKYPIVKGYGGSDADFTEVSVATLVDIVSDLMLDK